MEISFKTPFNLIKILIVHTSGVESLTVLLDGTLSSGSFVAIKIWDSVKGIEIKTLIGHDDSIYWLAAIEVKTLKGTGAVKLTS